jgi:hypothetical protein
MTAGAQALAAHLQNPARPAGRFHGLSPSRVRPWLASVQQRAFLFAAMNAAASIVAVLGAAFTGMGWRAHSRPDLVGLWIPP